MTARVRTPVLLVVCFVLVGPTRGLGQRAAFGADLVQVVSGGEGIRRDCSSREYSTGFGAAVALPLQSQGVGVALTGRIYPLGLGGSCAIDTPPLPENGTHTFQERLNLQAARFGTTDIRLQGSPLPGLSLALGGGMAWHRGRDLPYGVIAAGLQVLARGPFRLGLAGEGYALRVTTDRTRVTYVNGVAVLVEPRVREHQLSRMVTVAVAGTVALF